MACNIAPRAAPFSAPAPCAPGLARSLITPCPASPTGPGTTLKETSMDMFELKRFNLDIAYPYKQQYDNFIGGK